MVQPKAASQNRVRLSLLYAAPIALLGGLLAGIVPAAWLKFSLGLILMVSAWRIFRGSRDRPVAPDKHHPK